MYNVAVMHAVNDEVVAAQQRVSSSHLLPSSLAFAFSSLCSSLAFAFPSLFPAFLFSSLPSSLAFAFSSLLYSLLSSLLSYLLSSLPSSLAFAFSSLRSSLASRFPSSSALLSPPLSQLFPCFPFPTCLALHCSALLFPQPHHTCLFLCWHAYAPCVCNVAYIAW